MTPGEYLVRAWYWYVVGNPYLARFWLRNAAMLAGLPYAWLDEEDGLTP